MTDIKSTAVVKYSATKEPEPYCELELNTNLNSPPEKWLQGRFGEKEPFVPGRSSAMAGKELNSFMMANNFLDYVGSVDAITDGENVKKLLKMPYSNSAVSMMVHRIGKTLLIDQFDIYQHVLMAQQQEWKWLREFITDTLTESGVSQALIPAHARGCGRKDVQEKLMLSKFLYYSLADGQLTNVESDSSVDLPSKPESSPVPDPLRNDVESGGLPHQGNSYERNVLWRLEDIRMLVGNNMPIFGGGTHPCVSLRLKDMKKPINVLTGIDYWLDQLMCNVPEVVMCYHLNGIVQKYEVIKTEDLPNLPDCQFNTEIVRDVAQNILSFLKSNATKEGHTYWLFKGHDDDVVKLYDLTSICKEYMTDNDVNPFTLPVAVLMYRVARNLLQKMQAASSAMKAAATVYRLLNHCLELIDKTRSPQVSGSVHYLLATLYITCGWPILDDQEKKGNSKSEESAFDAESDEFDDSFDVNDWFTFDDDPNQGKLPLAKQLGVDEQEGNCSCVSLSVLTKMDQGDNEEQQPSTTHNVGNESKRMPNGSNLEDCCKTALEHIYEGFECVEMYANLRVHQDEEDGDCSGDPLPKPADKNKPIPLRYEPIQRAESRAKFLPLAIRQPTAATSSFQPELSALLFVKAATAYYLLADCAFKLEHYGKALRYVSLGLLCYESLRTSFSGTEAHALENRVPVVQAKRTAEALLPSVLMLCGDVHIAVCHQKPHLLRKDRRDLTVQVYRDEKIAEKARKALPDDWQCEYVWCTELPESMEQNLILSSKCYDAAIKLIKEAVVSVGDSSGSPKKTKKFEGAEGGEGLSNLIVDSVVVARRQGNVKNELGLYYMNVAMAISAKEENPKTNLERIEKYWHASFAAFQEGISIFQKLNDDSNESLLNSNCARLMRTCAHAYADSKEQFGAQERHYYHKATEMYQRALDCVNRKSTGDHTISSAIAWDLSSAYFTYATQMQERPPLNTFSLEEVEREIVDYMHKAMRLVENLERVNSSKHDVYLYRSSSIHHKLASLYYRLFMEKEAEKDKKAKQLKALTELHYSKAADGFRELVAENPCEFIRVQMERVALLEFCIENVGNAAKLKLSQEAIRLLFSCQIGYISLCRKMSGRRLVPEEDTETIFVPEGANTTQLNGEAKESMEPGQSADVDEGQLKECQTLCDLTLQRLQAICKSALKVCMAGASGGKAGQHKDKELDQTMLQWKRVYAVTLIKSKPDDVVKLPGFILTVLQQMAKEMG